MVLRTVLHSRVYQDCYIVSLGKARTVHDGISL